MCKPVERWKVGCAFSLLRTKARYCASFLILLELTVVAYAQGGAPNEFCAGCHETGEKLAKSAHSGVGCSSCHIKHEEYPHPADIPKPECRSCHAAAVSNYEGSVHGAEARKGNGAAPTCALCHGDVHEVEATKTAEFRRNVPNTCGMCHGEVNEHYARSVHGQAAARGVVAAPVCTDCHGIHNIQRAAAPGSAVSPQQQPKTCGRCHGDLRLTSRFGLPPDRITSFESSFHGLALKAGRQTVASCSSCHGVHDILPSSDPASKIHPSNLGKTCGACHPGAGQRFALGRIHVLEGQVEFPPSRLARQAYLILIPLTLGFMLMHQGGDFLRKLWKYRLSSPARHVMRPIAHTVHPELRMHGWERLQHALLALSFIVLVWTGFALKYPDQWWARVFIPFESKYALRGLIHRAAGVVLIACGLLHVITLIASRRLRRHWVELIPRRNDVHEFLTNTAYCLGLRREKPRVSPHSYIEKIEYWAVVWGTVVMGATGVFLWANNFVLARVPDAKDWLDFATMVHFYEAVLAAASILIWHFYMVIFDPEVYPMDVAWLNGLSLRVRNHRHNVDVNGDEDSGEAPEAGELKNGNLSHPQG